MRKIGNANGIELNILEDSFFSFFNSPYIGHKNESSVDVYPSHMEWNGPAFSPVNGKIVKIRQLKMGKQRTFETCEVDYAIGIRPEGIEGSVVRILHCKPSIEKNDFVEAGDVIGNLIRSRYFNFWTDPHYHIEVIDDENFNRSSKSFPITKGFDRTGSIEVEGREFITQTDWTVARVTADYILVTSSSCYRGSINNVHGHVVEVDSVSKGLLDAGVPHYPHGGVFGSSIKSGSVTIDESVIGFLEQQSSPLFNQNKEHLVYVNEHQVRGISTYLYSKAQLIAGKIPLKIVPRLYDGFSNIWEEGDSIRLSFRPLV